MVGRHAAYDARFDLDLFDVGLPFHFVAGDELFHRVDARPAEHLDGFVLRESREHFGNAAFSIKPALFRLFFPFLGVAVAVEENCFQSLLDHRLQKIHDGRLQSLSGRKVLGEVRVEA